MAEYQHYLTAKEAAAALQISRATLYAYVSRGLIRSEPVAGQARRRRYRADDVHRLRERKVQRNNPSLAAERALHFGAPVLASSLTLIDGKRFYYRGEDALRLAVTRSVEEVASFIWSGEWSPIALQGTQTVVREGNGQTAGLSMLERFQRELPLVAASDLAAYDLQPSTVRLTGTRILALLTVIAAGVPLQHDLVSTLLHGWRIDLPGTEELLSAALILCADHELNVSSFTARCVASAGSTPYQVVQAGLAALQGTKHGGHTARVAALLEEVRKPARARATLGERLRRGESIPGFGHVLYPHGDPRARLLLQLMTEIVPESSSLLLAQAVARETEQLVGHLPTIDFALATLARLFGRPTEGGLTIFALGRTVGWIGHALEQYRLDKIIRPRARYDGPLPGGLDENAVRP